MKALLLVAVLFVACGGAEARSYFADEDPIAHALRSGNERALRNAPPAGDLELLQMTATDFPPLPQRLPPLDTRQMQSSKTLPKQLPSIQTSQGRLKTLLDQNQNQDALTLASLAETEKQAVLARHHSDTVKVKKTHLLSLAAKLQAKLKAALSKSVDTRHAANEASKRSFTKVRTARNRAGQNQRAHAMDSQLKHEYKVDEARLMQSKEKVAAIDKTAVRKAKYQMKLADEEADEVLQQAKTKAAALRKHAIESAKRGVAKAREEEKELRDDARSELAVTKRKLRRVQRLLKVTGGLSAQAQGRAWSSMTEMQQLKHDEEKAKAEVTLSKHQLNQVQQTIKTLE